MADEERPQYQHGVGTIGGTQFHWGSGTPGKYWSVPYGDYPVTPDAPTGAWAHSVGAIPISNNIIPDALLHRNRVGIMIHSGSADNLDQLYTQGCFKVAPQEWPAVRSQILAEAEKGPLYLHVAPGGVAAFTNTKTFSQAGGDTPAATANASANTTAANTSANAQRSFVLPPNAPMGMGNNNPLNIIYDKSISYPGLVGPSKNLDAGNPQNVFDTPESGWNAGYQLLKRKYGGGMTTANDIIWGKSGWTPGNLQAAKNVAELAGIKPDEDIGFNDPAKAAKFMRALVIQEQGQAGKAYSDEMIANAVSGKPAAAPTAVASAAPIGTTVNNTGPAAPAAGASGILPGFGTKEASDNFAKGIDKMTGGKGLGTDGQPQGQDQGPPQIQASPIIQGPGAHIPIPPIYGQTLNSMGQNPMSQSEGQLASPYAAGQPSPIGTSLNSMGSIDASLLQFPQFPPGWGGMGRYGYPSGGQGYG